MFSHASRRYGTPGRLVRLSYSIDLRYGVLYDIARSVHGAKPVPLDMGYANVIWQGDANEQTLRLLAHCASPTSPINLSGPKLGVRWLAEEFGKRFGRKPIFSGEEAKTAWLVDTAAANRLLGAPRISTENMIDWVADWIARGQPGLGKPTHFEARDGKY
jgi:hypothetical protein